MVSFSLSISSKWDTQIWHRIRATLVMDLKCHPPSIALADVKESLYRYIQYMLPYTQENMVMKINQNIYFSRYVALGRLFIQGE